MDTELYGRMLIDAIKRYGIEEVENWLNCEEVPYGCIRVGPSRLSLAKRKVED